MRVILLVSLLFVANVICQNFFILSDIHYDPFYDPNQSVATFCRDNTTKLGSSPVKFSASENLPIYGQYGCDTPYPLLVSTLEAMKSANSNPDFIILNGDTSGHSMASWEQTMLAITNVTLTIGQYFPGVPVFPCLGNNDLFPDYQMPLGPNELLNTQYSLWSKAGWLTSENQDSFENGGFYIRELVPGFQLVVLNTIVYDKNWCPENTTDCISGSDAGVDPLDQFAWLSDQLSNIEQSGQKAVLMSHISPGVDIKFSTMWHKQYVAMFQSIFGNFSNTIAIGFFSHLHRDAFRLVYDQSNTGALILSSSVSPKDLNNPTFRLVSYDKSTFELLDYTDYYADLSQTLQGAAPVWQELYTFSSAYNLQGVNAKNYLALYDALDTWSDQPFDDWLEYYVSNSGQDFPYYPSDYYLCSLKCISDSCIEDCGVL